MEVGREADMHFEKHNLEKEIGENKRVYGLKDNSCLLPGLKAENEYIEGKSDFMESLGKLRGLRGIKQDKHFNRKKENGKVW